jgi:hypothetical protein
VVIGFHHAHRLPCQPRRCRGSGAPPIARDAPGQQRSAQARRRACRARPAMVDGAVHLVARLMLALEADGPATGGRR